MALAERYAVFPHTIRSGSVSNWPGGICGRRPGESFAQAVIRPRRQLILEDLNRGAAGDEIRADLDPELVADTQSSRTQVVE